MCGHAFVDGVADDPVGGHVLDRADVELPFARGVLGDVGQPHLVGPCRGEVSLHQVVMDGGTRASLADPALLCRGRPDPVLTAQPRHPALADLVAGTLELIGDEPVAELGIIGVDVDDRIDQVSVVPIAVADRLGSPLVERLGREAEHPAGRPHRDALGGQFQDQRERHFGRCSAAK